MSYRTNKSTFRPNVNKSQKPEKFVPELWNVGDWFVLLLFPVAVAIVLLALLFQVIESYSNPI